MTITPIEFIGAFFGVLGTALLAVRCRYSGWGFVAYLVSNAAWIVFAVQQQHDGMLVQQIVFVASSLVGVWVWLVQPRLHWGEWRGDFDGNATMHIMRLATWRSKAGEWRLDVHKMVGADMPGCYHTHPAKALRLIVWGGYHEEVEGQPFVRTWLPGMAGIVQPQLSHRIDALRGRVNYSLWLRWPKTHEVQLRGPGWNKDKV